MVSPKLVNKSGEFLEDGIGSSSPDKWARVAVVVLHEFFDPSNQFAYASEAATANGLLSNQAKSAFPSG